MEEEFNILNRRMEKNLEMRHTYLMFAFTTAIAAIAFLFTTDIEKINYWGCITPFAVIIPFQARISYSRLTHAKMEAYLVTHYPGKFAFLEKPLNELSGLIGKLIAIIANFELTILSIIIDIIFFIIKYDIESAVYVYELDCIIIFSSTIIVAILAIYTYPYVKFLDKYIKLYNKQELK